MPKKTIPQNPMATKEAASRFVGAKGFFRVDSKIHGELPIWIPVRVEQAWPAYGRMDFICEPIGGYGAIKCSSRKVFFPDDRINLCKDRPNYE